MVQHAVLTALRASTRVPKDSLYVCPATPGSIRTLAAVASAFNAKRVVLPPRAHLPTGKAVTLVKVGMAQSESHDV